MARIAIAATDPDVSLPAAIAGAGSAILNLWPAVMTRLL